MDKFLSDQRLLVFLGALLLMMGSWGADVNTWRELFTTHSVFTFFASLGSLLLANQGSNIFKKPPTITETTSPAATVTTIVTTPPKAD